MKIAIIMISLRNPQPRPFHRSRPRQNSQRKIFTRRQLHRGIFHLMLQSCKSAAKENSNMNSAHIATSQSVCLWK